VTSIAKHITRKPLPAVTAVAAEQRSRNRQLRNAFPPRPVEEWWPHAAASVKQVQDRLTAPPFAAEASATRAGRRRGVTKLLRWLSSLPGDTDRWLASGAEERFGRIDSFVTHGRVDCLVAADDLSDMRWQTVHDGVGDEESACLRSRRVQVGACGD
jgi:hypothetical protein